ncbi:MAG: ATP-binding protein [Lachnospiraceae bacterium]
MLTDSQQNAITRIYDNRRTAAVRLKDSRIEELYLANPEIKEIDDELRRGSIQAGILAVKGNTSGLDSLRARNDSLIGKKKKLIKAAGFPEDYLENIYQCPLCKDTGKTEEGRCICYSRTIINEFFLTDERRKLLERENFKTLDETLYSREIIDKESGQTEYQIAQDSIITALNFAGNFGNEFTNLLITGNAGTGKTFLANCIAKKLIEKGISVLYLSAVDFFDLCRNYRTAQQDEMKNAANELNFVLNAECLIIDDLGTESGTAATNSQLFNCIEKRYLKQLSTVITTNLTKEDLGTRYSDRIRSRLLANYKYLKMPGKDKRTQCRI